MLPDPPNPSEPFPHDATPPEIVEWARQTFDEADFLAQVREIEATGGLRLEDFIAELERVAGNDTGPRRTSRRGPGNRRETP